MAKQYRALSNIEHGEDVEDGNQITRFPFGSVVEGLPADIMKNLWDAGVLEEVDTAEPVVTRSVTVRPNDPTKGTGDGPPAAPDGTNGPPKPDGE